MHQNPIQQGGRKSYYRRKKRVDQQYRWIEEVGDNEKDGCDCSSQSNPMCIPETHCQLLRHDKFHFPALLGTAFMGRFSFFTLGTLGFTKKMLGYSVMWNWFRSDMG